MVQYSKRGNDCMFQRYDVDELDCLNNLYIQRINIFKATLLYALSDDYIFIREIKEGGSRIKEKQ